MHTSAKTSWMYACGIATSLAAIVSLAPVSNPPPRPVRDNPLEWGVYQILWSAAYCDQLEDTLTQFVTRPHYVMFYRDLLRPYPLRPIRCIRDKGAIPIVSLELWHWHDHSPQLTRILNGKYDHQFRAWATYASKYAHPVFLRFGFEFNGDWFSWSGEPAAYRAAWRRVHDIFTEAGADNVTWVWCPNVVSCPDTPENAIEHYYPGDAYVDWIGIDGYNFGDHHDQWHRWESVEAVFDDTLNQLHDRYPDKPIMIAEFGSADADPDRRAAWIREAHAYLLGRPQVRAAVWFNYDKRREGEPNWRIDTSEASLGAFNATFAAPPSAGDRP